MVYPKIVVTPEDFCRAFREVVDPGKEALASKWKLTDEYTNIFLGKRGADTSILSRVCAQLNSNKYQLLQCWNEYLTFDMVYYHRAKPDFQPNPMFSDYVVVAIEHENDFKTSLQEMNKLCQLNAPLSVLIAYPDGSEETHKRGCEQICSAADVHGSFCSSQKKLLIHGTTWEREYPEWFFYLFNGRTFEKLDTIP